MYMNSRKSDNYKHFCNNCGKTTHTFNKCKEPITSMGVIAFRHNTINQKVEFLMIQRKDSLGFVDLVRGKYNLKNKQYIINIINEMTTTEKQMVIQCTFEELWKHMWSFRQLGLKYKNEYDLAFKKFNTLKNGLHIGNETIILEDLIKNSKTQWIQPEWGFPKGRRNYKENDLTTALREFEEETGMKRYLLNVVSNLLPIEEVFTGSNFKSYKCKYFLANIPYDESEHFNKQDCEVNDIGWFSSDIGESIIRPYNIEKIDILRQMNELIYKSNFLR